MKNIRGVLNKITPQHYEDLKHDFFNHLECDIGVHGKLIIEIIFNKAVDEPTYCELYRSAFPLCFLLFFWLR